MNKIVRIVLLLSMCSTVLWASGAREVTTLRVGILPDVDSLPFMVAQEEHLFSHSPIPIQLVLFTSPVERDAAFQSGSIDGMVSDLLSAFFLHKAGFTIAITSTTDGRYGLVVSPYSTRQSIGELANIEIGISKHTIIEYIASQFFTHESIPLHNFTPIAIPRIPLRLELLLQGKLEAACLPEPFYTTAITKGARPIVDSSILDEVPGVMIFSQKALKEKREGVIALYHGYWEAAQRLNTTSDAYRDFLISQAHFPEEIRDVFPFVHYHKPNLPTANAIEQVAQWMIAQKLLEQDISYNLPIDETFVREVK